MGPKPTAAPSGSAPRAQSTDEDIPNPPQPEPAKYEPTMKDVLAALRRIEEQNDGLADRVKQLEEDEDEDDDGDDLFIKREELEEPDETKGKAKEEPPEDDKKEKDKKKKDKKKKVPAPKKPRHRSAFKDPYDSDDPSSSGDDNDDKDAYHSDDSIARLEKRIQHTTSDIGSAKIMKEVVGGGKIKVSMPKEYDGKARGTKADEFITSCELVFVIKKDYESNKSRIAFAISYLIGSARSWAQPILRDLLGPRRSTEAREWKSFRKAFNTAFGESDRTGNAIRELEKLKQTRSAAEYISDFRRIGMELTDWHEDTLKHYFRKGLKDEVKDNLPGRGTSKMTLYRLMKVVQEIDQEQFHRRQEHALETRNSNKLGQKNINKNPTPQPFVPFKKPAATFTPKAPSGSRNNPIDVSAVTTAPPPKYTRLTPELRQQLLQEGRCFYCRETGHLASAHRQVAAIEEETPETPEISNIEQVVEEALQGNPFKGKDFRK